MSSGGGGNCKQRLVVMTTNFSSRCLWLPTSTGTHLSRLVSKSSLQQVSVWGATVVVAKRFTVEYDPVKSKNLRADVTTGTELSVKGYALADADRPNSKPRLVFSFSLDFGKKHAVLTIDAAIDASKVKLPRPWPFPFLPRTPSVALRLIPLLEYPRSVNIS